MITGIGTDIVKIDRIRKVVAAYEEQFLHRCFTAAERQRCNRRHDPIRAYARLFAAKEALLKALGTGMREGLSWQDWEIMPDHQGAPSVTVRGGAAAKLGSGAFNIRLSLSDDADYAVAFAVIERI